MREVKINVCYSGGHNSALCAIECVRKYGKENVILLNHDIIGSIAGVQIEDQDIKRFKQEVADYLGLPITYANSKYKTPAEVIEAQGIIHNPTLHVAVCTYYLKTLPFMEALTKLFPVEKGKINEDVRLIYGFDKDEPARITRKVGTACNAGYQCEFPMLWEHRTIYNTEEIGIKRPKTYDI